jgi:hypothetical protein
MKIEIEARLLRAALICAAKSDIRYCLNGVAIEVHDERALVVATDGHRLFIGRSHSKPRGKIEGGAQTFIVPHELVERALKSLPKKSSGFSLDFTFPVTIPGEVSIKAIDAGFTGALVDARFPDWRRIASVQRQSTDSGQFKPEYVADCQRVAECFLTYAKGAAYVDIAHNGPANVALVTFSTTADACIFLMPLRTFDAHSVKDWLKQETGAEWDMPEPEVKP